MMDDPERLIPVESVCADLDLPLRKLRAASRALNAITEDRLEIGESDLRFVADGIEDQVYGALKIIKDIDLMQKTPPQSITKNLSNRP